MNDWNNTHVYESPDRGETVYARLPGAVERILVKESDAARSMREELQENELWRKIRAAAKTNRALNKALEDAKILYHLTNNA